THLEPTALAAVRHAVVHREPGGRIAVEADVRDAALRRGTALERRLRLVEAHASARVSPRDFARHGTVGREAEVCAADGQDVRAVSGIRAGVAVVTGGEHAQLR